MERKIGEIFEYNGEWYQCVKGNTCDECSFSKSSWNCLFDGTPYCSDRSDEIEVIFKKLEKVGEPYMLEAKKFQKYRVFHTPYIYNKIDYSWQSFADPYYISLEIKQNKEDMEEKKQCGDTRFRIIARAKEHLFQATNIAEDKKELEVLDSFLLRCWQMGWLKQYEDAEEKKLKPFDIEAAKQGKPVCTREGRKARIICFDLQDPEYDIVALLLGKNGFESICTFNSNGRFNDADGVDKQSKHDLMMLPEKKEGWINICRNLNTNKTELDTKDIYNTKEEALQNLSSMTYVTTVKINWEE